jgi:gliding motility-associated-like protein
MNKFVMVLVLALFVNYGFAQTYTQPCISDTRLSFNDACTSWQVTNYGAATIYLAATWTWVGIGCSGGDIRFMQTFDVNPTTSPQALYDNRATLNLFFPTGSAETHFFTGSGTDNQFYIQRVTTTWAENVVTWNTQPATTAVGQILVPSAATNPSTQDYQIDVSTMVYDWICGTTPNYGFKMTLVNEGQTYRRVTFCSREYATASKHPTLSLEYAYIAATGPDTICEGDAFNINCALNNANNPANYNYQWIHPNSGTNYATQNIVNPVWVLGLNTYIVTVTNPWCQTAKDTVEIFVEAQPIVDAGNDTSICAGQNTQLTASGGSTYSWSNGGNTAGINVSPTATTTYVVTVSNGNCSATDDVVVTVVALPIANAGNDTSICAGQSAQLTASGGSTYSWSNGGNTAGINVSPTVTTTYVVTVSNGNCSATDDVVVTVVALPIADAGNDTSICAGQSAQLTASGGSTYSWSNGGNTAGINVTPAITTTYVVTVSNGNCSATDDVVVTVVALPIANAGNDTSICAGQSAQLTASGGSTYSWSNGGNTAGINVSPAITTTYVVTVSNGNCSATDDVVVTVVALPIADAGNDTSICAGQSVQLTASGGSTYSWSNGGNTAGINVSPAITTTYVVTVSNGNCSATDDVVVTVVAQPIADAGNDTAICINDQASLLASGGGSYLWSNGVTTAINSVSPLITTTYTVTVDNGVCIATDDVVVTVNDYPQISLQKTDAHCGHIDGSVIANVSGGNGTYTYSWSPVASTNSQINNIPGGNYAVTVTSAGCSSVSSIVVSDLTGPQAVFSMSATIIDVDQVVYFYDYSIGAFSWYWTFGDGNNSILQNPTNTYHIPGSYDVWLYVEDNYGCRDSTSQIIQVNNAFMIHIPNSFSPNGDGINDIFMPLGIRIDEEHYIMQIYDRWGKKVFETTDVYEGWNGTVNGRSISEKDMMTAVFVYYIYVVEEGTDADHEYRGGINLIR